MASPVQMFPTMMLLLTAGFFIWLFLAVKIMRKDPSFLKTAALLAVTLLWAILPYVLFIEPNEIAVKTIRLNGTGTSMKIIFMTDFQRNDADPSFVRRAVDLANKENPDLVLLGGDYVELDESELPSIAPLRELKAKYGAYAVLGNHDYGIAHAIRVDTPSSLAMNSSLAARIGEFLEEDGTITVLSNENRGFGSVSLIALDDLWAGKRNESKALEGIGGGDTADGGTYRIMLSHNQDGLVISDSTADLYLFGHTHCGQVRLPFLGSVPKMVGFRGEYDYGLYAVNGSAVYSSCGLAAGPRLFAPPEVTVIELEP